MLNSILSQKHIFYLIRWLDAEQSKIGHLQISESRYQHDLTKMIFSVKYKFRRPAFNPIQFHPKFVQCFTAQHLWVLFIKILSSIEFYLKLYEIPQLSLWQKKCAREMRIRVREFFCLRHFSSPTLLLTWVLKDSIQYLSSYIHLSIESLLWKILSMTYQRGIRFRVCFWV